jgi:uncharacterized membrane protein YkvA (DUF1232 family)
MTGRKRAQEGQMWFRAQAGTWSNTWSNAWPDIWPDIAALTRRMVGNEQELQRQFWRKLKRLVASLPFAEDLLAAYYCAFDKQTPLKVKAVLLGAIAYFILPTDLIPDYIPVIGYTDDAAVLAAAIKIVSSHITPEHREAARRMLAHMRGEA